MNEIKSFGSYNIDSEECKEGYIENGEMKFRKYPFYKRIYYKLLHNFKNPLQIESVKSIETVVEKYIGVKNIYMKNMIFGHRRDITIAVYRKYIKETNKTLNIYGSCEGRNIYFNVDAYIHDKQLILN